MFSKFYMYQSLQVPTGSISGLILNDQVEVYHILWLSVRASGYPAADTASSKSIEVK